MNTPTLQDLRNSLNDGSLYTVDSKTLKHYLVLLSQSSGLWSSEQIYVALVGNIINHILMQRHIDSLNRQNAITQYLVIALTIAALLVAIPQIWFAYKADKRTETGSETHLKQQSVNKLQMPVPIQAPPPSNHQSASPVKGAATATKKP